MNKCLEILKNKNIINNNTSLAMITFEIKAVNYNISNYYFELYDDSNRLEINLSICNENNTNYTFDVNNLLFPNFTDNEIDIDITDNTIINNTNNIYSDFPIINDNITNNTNASKNNEDNNNSNTIIINSDSKYNDECSVFFSEDGAVVLVEDRVITYISNNSFSNNTFTENITTSTNFSASDLFSEYIINSDNYNIDTDIPYNTGIYINSCPPNCFVDKIDYTTKKVYCSCPLENENNNQINELKSNSNTRKLNPKRNTKSTSYSSSKSNIYVLKCIGNISKYFKKNYILIIFTFLVAGYIATAIIYFIFYRNKYVSNINSEKIKKLQKIKTLSNSYKIAVPPKGRQRNNISNNKSLKIMDSNNDIKSSYGMQQKNTINNNIDYNKFKDYNVKHSITLPPEISINSDNDNTDLDLADYNTAISKDKRSFCQIFLSISQKKTNCFTQDHNILVLKISLFIFCLINYFAVNLFFFKNNVIHKIYIDKGKYNFGYQIKFILLSSLISCIFLYIAKYIFTFQKSPKQLIQVIKCIDFSLIIFILLFIFYWIYIGSFCSVFIKTLYYNNNMLYL